MRNPRRNSDPERRELERRALTGDLAAIEALAYVAARTCDQELAREAWGLAVDLRDKVFPLGSSLSDLPPDWDEIERVVAVTDKIFHEQWDAYLRRNKWGIYSGPAPAPNPKVRKNSVDDELRALERLAFSTKDPQDVNRWIRAAERVGASATELATKIMAVDLDPVDFGFERTVTAEEIFSGNTSYWSGRDTGRNQALLFVSYDQDTTSKDFFESAQDTWDSDEGLPYVDGEAVALAVADAMPPQFRSERDMEADYPCPVALLYGRYNGHVYEGDECPFLDDEGHDAACGTCEGTGTVVSEITDRRCDCCRREQESPAVVFLLTAGDWELPAKKNPDEDLRRLEREVQAGDLSLLPRLAEAYRRVGRVNESGEPILWEGRVKGSKLFIGSWVDRAPARVVWSTFEPFSGRYHRTPGTYVAEGRPMLEIFTESDPQCWIPTPSVWVAGIPSWLGPVDSIKKNPDESIQDLRRLASTGDLSAQKRLYRALERVGQRPSPDDEFETIEVMRDDGSMSQEEADKRQEERVRAGLLTTREKWLIARLRVPTVLRLYRDEDAAARPDKTLNYEVTSLRGWDHRPGDIVGDYQILASVGNSILTDDRGAYVLAEVVEWPDLMPEKAAQISRLMRQVELDPWGNNPGERLEEIAEILGSNRIDAFDHPVDGSPLYIYVAWDDWDRPTLFWRFDPQHGFLINTTTRAERLVERLSR